MLDRVLSNSLNAFHYFAICCKNQEPSRHLPAQSYHANNDANGGVLVSLLLILDIFHTLF